MRKVYSLLAYFITLSLVTSTFLIPVSAYSVNPPSGTLQASSSVNIDIVAAPSSFGSNINSAEVYIGASNLTITNYTPPTSNTWNQSFNLGVCDNGQKFSSTEVCITLVKNPGQFISDGESLGTITVTTPASGTGTLSRLANSGAKRNTYSDGVDNFTIPAGQVGSYTFSTSGSNTGASILPNTSSGEVSGTAIALLSASTLVVLGLVTYSIVNKKNLEI